MDDSGSAIVKGVKTQFFASSANKSAPAAVRDALPLIRQWREHEAAPSWEGFDTCHICIRHWNFDFEGPRFAIPYEMSGAYLDELTLSVTCHDPTDYPIKATGYLYSRNNDFFGIVDLRYFGGHMPRTLRFNLDEHRLPASTRIEIRFAVDGGGAPNIPRPPSITSVAVGLTTSGSF